MKKITDKTYKALCILRDYPDISARGFAEKMWGLDAKIFNSVLSCNNGVQRGKAAWLCAGSYIGRLKRRKLVTHRICGDGEYEITEEGIKAIVEYERNIK